MKKILTSILFICLMLLSSQIVFAQIDFNDIGDDYPYIDAINDFSTRGVVIGYPDLTFRPDQQITRAEFLKIALIDLLDFQEDQSADSLGCFEDTVGHWGEKYICKAYELGIVQGDGETGLFSPNRNINFAEAAKIISKTKGETEFYKEDSLDFWYQQVVDELVRLKAVPSTVNSVDHFVTRAESVEMLYRSSNEIGTYESFNIFPNYDFARTLVYLDDFNSLMDSSIVDEDYMVVASDVGDMTQIEDEDCADNCPWRNDEFLFYNSTMFYDVNFEQLDFLNEMIAVDGQYVYYFFPSGGSGIIEGVDLDTLAIPDNFEILYYEIDPDRSPSPYLAVYQIMDDENAYLILNSDLFDGKGNLWRQALETENPDLEFIRNGEEEAILFIPNPNNVEVEFEGKHHIVFDNKAYFLNSEIDGVDIESFEVYMNHPHFEWHQQFSRDKDNVYYSGMLVEGADPDTLIPLDSSWYYEDKDYVYNYKGEKLDGIDSQDYRTVANGYAVLNDDLIYMFGHLVEGMDPDTFVYDSISCIHDADHYYLEGGGLPGEYIYSEVTQEEWLEQCSS